MIFKKLAVVVFGLTVCCAAQSTSISVCQEADRKTANDLARHFLTELRDRLDLASLRPRYLSSTCDPIFTDLVELDASLNATIDCEVKRRFGDTSFEFTFLLFESALRSAEWPIENPLSALPSDITRRLGNDPIFRELWDDQRTEKVRITSTKQLEDFIHTLQQVSEVARQYIRDHPETAVQAASRLEAMKRNWNGGKPWTECTNSDDATYFGLPKGTPITATVESLFLAAIVREDESLKIAKITLVSD